MGKHTPGPWSVYVEEDGTLDGCVASMNEAAGTGDIVCLAPSDGGWDESHKRWPENARLIAAAPDLLNALTVLADACESMGIPVDAARAAIAKATSP